MIQIAAKQILTETKKEKSFDFNLESLRGIAALAVVQAHILFANSPQLDPGWTPSGIWSYEAPAHPAVLVFFLLSGYVIRLTTPAPLTSFTTLTYIKKRVVRIYPIYLVCLLIALLATDATYSGSTLLGHLALTAGLLSPVIHSISPAWTLGYEMAFYLAFIPISAYNLPPLRVAVLSFLVGFISAYFGAALLSSFGFGLCFWLVGVALVDAFRHQERETKYATMASLVFLFLCIEQLDGVTTIFSRLVVATFGRDLSQLPLNQPGAVVLRDVLYLPLSIMIILAFSSHKFKYMRAVHAALLLLPAITFYHYYKHAADLELAPLVLPLTFYALAITCFLIATKVEVLSKKLVERFFAVGAISYAIYILHFPLLKIFSRIDIFSGSALTFLARMAIFLVLVFTGAYLLDKKLQPWIKNKLFAK